MAKLVVVTGALGKQGSSVVEALLSNPSYKIRGISRNIKSEKAKALTAKGIEMVAADLNDEESLVKAFQGANVIYAYTNFFETFATQGPGPAIEVETKQGINMAKVASKLPTLEHYIWSTLPNSSTISNGTMKIPHFQAKCAVDEYIKKDALLFQKTTFLWLSTFAETLTYPILIPSYLKSAGKYIQLSPISPTTPVLWLGNHVHNTGVFVSAILSKPHATLPGKYVLASTETITMGETLEKWSNITGKQVDYVQIPFEAYDKLWPMWGREVGLNLKLWEEFGVKECWGTENWVGGEELGIEEGLLGVEDALREMDWNALL